MSTAVPHQHNCTAPQLARHEPVAQNTGTGPAHTNPAPPPTWADSSRQLMQSSQIAQLQATTPSRPPVAQGGLPEGLRRGIESLSGMDMSGVRVHRNSGTPAALLAHAYAQGTDIHLGPGQEKHLPHEAWHVVQQAQGRVRPTMQTVSGVTVNDDGGLEREADVMGQRAMVRAGQRREAEGNRQDLTPTSPNSLAPVQRQITANRVPYATATDFATLRGLIGQARMKRLGSTSKKLLAWITDPRPKGDFDDVDDLFDTLVGARQRGIQAQQIGEEREERAGGSAGGLSRGRIRGDVIYQNNGVQLCAGHGDQDPYLKHRDGSALQLDTATDQVWGLVGGPAKAKNNKAVDTELGRLTVLRKCCVDDGQHEPVVRYNDIQNPQEAGFARLVQGALGRGISVYVNGEWQRHGGNGQAQGHSTARYVGNAVGGLAGGLAGAYGGAKLGAALGTSLGPVGTVVGGVLGGIGGYFLGGKVGEQIGKRL